MGNGLCERFNRTLLHLLATLSEDKKTNWRDYVFLVVHAYNATKHESTGMSPHYLMFGRHPRLAVDLYFNHDPNGRTKAKETTTYLQDLKKKLEYAYELGRTKTEIAAKDQKKTFERRNVLSGKLRPGNRVLLKNVTQQGKLENFWEDQVFVVKYQPNDDIPAYVIEEEGGKKIRTLHRNLLFPCPFQALTQPELLNECSSPSVLDVIEKSSSSPRPLCRSKRRRKKRERFSPSDSVK